jgi:hypothetical protein
LLSLPLSLLLLILIVFVIIFMCTHMCAQQLIYFGVYLFCVLFSEQYVYVVDNFLSPIQKFSAFVVCSYTQEIESKRNPKIKTKNCQFVNTLMPNILLALSINKLYLSPFH